MDTIKCTLAPVTRNTSPSFACSIPEAAPGWTDIVTAFGTAGATLLALAFGVISFLIAKQERDIHRLQNATDLDDRLAREAADRAKAIRSQAERVACWLEIDTTTYPTHHIVVENSSDQPIWEVFVAHQFDAATASHFPVVAPRSRRRFSVQPSAQDEMAINVRFRDNSGRDWYRPGQTPGNLILERNQLFDDPAPGSESTTVDGTHDG